MTTGYVYDEVFLKHDLPGHPENRARLEEILVLLRERHRRAEGHPAGDDRHLVHRLREFEHGRDQRVAGLVVGGDPLLLVVHHASAFLRTRDHPVDGRQAAQLAGDSFDLFDAIKYRSSSINTLNRPAGDLISELFTSKIQ